MKRSKKQKPSTSRKKSVKKWSLNRLLRFFIVVILLAGFASVCLYFTPSTTKVLGTTTNVCVRYGGHCIPAGICRFERLNCDGSLGCQGGSWCYGAKKPTPTPTPIHRVLLNCVKSGGTCIPNKPPLYPSDDLCTETHSYWKTAPTATKYQCYATSQYRCCIHR